MSDDLFLLDPPEWVNPAPLLTSSREQSWRFDLLNRADVQVGVMDGVKSCSLNLNVNAEIRGGGSLTYAGEPIDWPQHRVQPWITVRGGGQEMSWPLGVFLMVSPEKDYGTAGGPVTLQLYDTGQRISGKSSTARVWSAPAGAVVTDVVRHLLGRAGVRSAVTDSTATLRTAMTWPPGTPYKRMINDLLDSINYFGIYVDAYGVFRADPYVRPQDRAPAFGFVDDGNSIYSTGFTHSADTFSIPNQVILVSQVDGEQPPMVATVEDNDPASPYSVVSTGLWTPHVEEGVDAADQATLQALAERRLSELQRVTSTYEITHLPVPLTLNDAVTFRRDAHGVSALTTVQTMELSMSDDLCRTTLREVAPA